MSAYLPILVKVPDSVDHNDADALGAYLVAVLEALRDGGIEAESDENLETRH